MSPKMFLPITTSPRHLERMVIKEIGVFISLSDEQVEDLIYLDPDPTNPTAYCLKKGEIGLIRSFIHFVHYRDEIGNPIGDDWRSITQDEFDQFHCNTKYTRGFTSLASLSSPTPSTPSTAPTPTPTPSHSAPSPVYLFKRGIKRDPSVYPTLKDELWNDNWHRSFANQARAQDLSDVLNAAYIPTFASNKSSFKSWVIKTVVFHHQVRISMKLIQKCRIWLHPNIHLKTIIARIGCHTPMLCEKYL
jgi:hypothetical protein